MKYWQNLKYFPVHKGLKKIVMRCSLWLNVSQFHTFNMIPLDLKYYFFQFGSFLCIYFVVIEVTEL